MKSRVLIFVFLVVWAAAAAAYDPAVILKKNSVEISKDRIYLGDVADISGVEENQAEDLATIYIKRAALPGYSIKVTRENIENQVKKEFRAIKVTGPEYVDVYTAKAEVAAADLVETAEKYVLENMPWKKEDVEITPAGKRSNAGIMGGTVLLKVRQENKTSFKGNVTVPVEINVNGKFYKLEPVTLLVKVKTVCLIAADDIKTRELLAGRVIADKKDITFLPGNVMTDVSMAANKIAKRAIIKGTVLCEDMFENAPMFRRGSTVNVVVKVRNITVETTGTAFADGREGGTAKVKLENGKILEGMVSAEGKVIIVK